MLADDMRVLLRSGWVYADGRRYLAVIVSKDVAVNGLSAVLSLGLPTANDNSICLWD